MRLRWRLKICSDLHVIRSADSWKPCVKRNVAGAVNAVSAAQLSLAGIKSAIPVDEVIDAMRRIGNEMSPNIKETGQGGLATTPTAIQIGKSL